GFFERMDDAGRVAKKDPEYVFVDENPADLFAVTGRGAGDEISRRVRGGRIDERLPQVRWAAYRADRRQIGPDHTSLAADDVAGAARALVVDGGAAPRVAGRRLRRRPPER